jgi:hypothetical protein
VITLGALYALYDAGDRFAIHRARIAKRTRFAILGDAGVLELADLEASSTLL